MEQKLDCELLLHIETNFCTTSNQLKWLSKIQDEFNTTIITNTNAFPVYTLDHSIYPLTIPRELNSQLLGFKRSIFTIYRKHKRIPPNLFSTQRHTQLTMGHMKLIYLPSKKCKEFSVISLNTNNQLALDHLKDNIYSEVTGIQSTQLENTIDNEWTKICKRRNILNKYRNNIITRNN